MELKKQRQDLLNTVAMMHEEKQRKKEQLRERQKLNKERREMNAKKAEIVEVVIKNFF